MDKKMLHEMETGAAGVGIATVQGIQDHNIGNCLGPYSISSG